MSKSSFSTWFQVYVRGFARPAGGPHTYATAKREADTDIEVLMPTDAIFLNEADAKATGKLLAETWDEVLIVPMSPERVTSITVKKVPPCPT